MHLQENTFFDLWAKDTQNVVQYPLHPVTYAPTKFEAATSNSLGGDAFTRNMTDGQTEGRLTDFGMKLLYPFFTAGIITYSYLEACLRLEAEATH